MANLMVEGYAARNYAIAGVLFLRVVPALVVGPIAGYVADRTDRRTVLVWGDHIRGLLFKKKSHYVSVNYRDVAGDPQGMVLELLANGKLDDKKLITHRFTLDQINEAFETAEAKQETGAVFVAINIS